MSKIPNNSYFVPRELEQDEYFKIARPLWKLVLYWLLSHSVYKEEYPYDLHGSLVMLKRGQVVFTLRQISDELNISKDIVDAAILHFSGFTTKREMSSLMAAGRQPILFRQNFRQDVRQEKSVYNIVWNGYYETCQTELPTEKLTTIPTDRRQTADINKKDKKERSGSLSKDNSPPPPNPLKEERRRGGRKEAYKSKGPISEEALRWNKITKDKGREISTHLLQGWIDIHSAEWVKEALKIMDAEIEKGVKVKIPHLYVGGILHNMYAKVG
jgi:hypothetical protein